MQLDKKFLESNYGKLKNISVGPLSDLPEKVLQFGEGNFLRAFVDWHFNEMNKQGLFNGKVVVVQPLKNGTINILNEQDNIYTLLLRGIQNGQQIEKTEIITSISRSINPYKEWNTFLNCASNPELRFIVSNTTEAGIDYVETKFPQNECPESFPAKVTAFLFERFKNFNGDKDKGMILIPCELIENNGDNLKKIISKHAEDWKLGKDFQNWLENSNYFFNTLVDRIVPGYPKDEIAELTKKLGYEDKAIVSAEIFHLWVIQGNTKVTSELPFIEAGLNVVWTDNINPYRTMKVRILNGAHTMFTIPSYLNGNETVKESVENKVTGGFIIEGLFKEILPTLEFSEEKKIEYTKSVLERFQNPFIKHYLESITLNSVSKFKVRVLPSLLKYYEMKNQVPDVLSFSLAALIAYYKGYCEIENKNKKILGRKLVDENYVLKFFDELKTQNNCDEAVKTILSNENLWDTDLNKVDNLTKKVCYYYRSISRVGMKSAIKKMMNNKMVA